MTKRRQTQRDIIVDDWPVNKPDLKTLIAIDQLKQQSDPERISYWLRLAS